MSQHPLYVTIKFLPHGGSEKSCTTAILPDCGYSTTLKDDLRNHKASVHNNIEDKIQCEMCPFATPRKRNLKYHMETIHKIGEGRFKCEYCPYTSSHVGNFRYHIKRKHEKVKKIRLLKD